METNKMQPQYNQDINVPHEVVKLPSKGLFYRDPEKRDFVKIGYLNASDDMILMDDSISERFVDILISEKLLQSPCNPNDLLTGDKNKILVMIRAYGIDNIITVNVFDPEQNKTVEGKFDLLDIKDKEMDEKPDENGEFSFTTPIDNNQIKFKFISDKKKKELREEDERKKPSYRNKVSQLPIKILKESITEFNGNRDKQDIEKEIIKLKIKDFRSIMIRIAKLEPGIDTNIEVKLDSGKMIKTKFEIPYDFFFPEI